MTNICFKTLLSQGKTFLCLSEDKRVFRVRKFRCLSRLPFLSSQVRSLEKVELKLAPIFGMHIKMDVRSPLSARIVLLYTLTNTNSFAEYERKSRMRAYSLDDITWVSIETTNVCNMTCDYCPKSLDELNHRKIGVDILAHDAYLKIVEFLPRLKNLKYVTLTAFNEFFQTPDLTSFYLPELQKRLIPYSIMSNGSIKPKNIDYYVGHNPKYLVLGVQTITAEQFYDTNRLERMSWEKYLELVAEQISFFYDKCPETLISIEVAVNPHNTWLQNAIGAATNQAIPSKNDQLKKLPEFVETISKMTGIEFVKKTGQAGRYSGQRIIFGSTNDRIGFGLKDFHDISDFYNNIPLSQAPVCYADSLTFNVKGAAKMCCIDFRDSTKFGDASTEDVGTIFENYLKLVDEMRRKGSPFADCRKCMGYKSKAEKYLNPVKPIKEYVKRSSSAVRVYRNLTR